jgi:hypothetical protein
MLLDSAVRLASILGEAFRTARHGGPEGPHYHRFCLVAAGCIDLTMDSKGNFHTGEAATAGRVQKFSLKE